jgi:hypothetical protein
MACFVDPPFSRVLLRWVARSETNFRTTVAYGLALCLEYSLRFAGRRHACQSHLEWLSLAGYPPKTAAALESAAKTEHDGMGGGPPVIAGESTVFATMDLPAPGCTPFPLCMERECVVDSPSGGGPSAVLSARAVYRFKDAGAFAMRFKSPVRTRPEWLGPEPERAPKVTPKRASRAKSATAKKKSNSKQTSVGQQSKQQQPSPGVAQGRVAKRSQTRPVSARKSSIARINVGKKKSRSLVIRSSERLRSLRSVPVIGESPL